MKYRKWPKGIENISILGIVTRKNFWYKIDRYVDVSINFTYIVYFTGRMVVTVNFISNKRSDERKQHTLWKFMKNLWNKCNYLLWWLLLTDILEKFMPEREYETVKRDRKF